MDQYEFTVIERTFHSTELYLRQLNELGQEGWHNPVHVGDYMVILQRKVPPLPPEPPRENENPCHVN